MLFRSSRTTDQRFGLEAFQVRHGDFQAHGTSPRHRPGVVPPLPLPGLLLRTRVRPPLLLVLRHRQPRDHVRQRLVEVLGQLVHLLRSPVVPFRDREPVQHMRFSRDRRPRTSQEEVGELVDEVGVFFWLLSITLS